MYFSKVDKIMLSISKPQQSQVTKLCLLMSQVITSGRNITNLQGKDMLCHLFPQYFSWPLLNSANAKFWLVENYVNKVRGALKSDKV